MIFCLTGAFAFLIVTIFQCHPLSYAWNKNIHGGKCINFNSVTWANGAINIFQDLLIIALPIPEVRNLQLERKKKIGLYIMFGLGGLWVEFPTPLESPLIKATSVCIASIVRLYTLKTFGLTADATWDNIPITVWTTLETTFAMLCTCLPTIRAGLLHIFPQAFGSTRTAATTSAKPAVSYQNTFEIPSMPKSWPSRKLTSESSLSVREDEVRATMNHDTRIKDVEMAKLKCERLRRGWIKGVEFLLLIFNAGMSHGQNCCFGYYLQLSSFPMSTVKYRQWGLRGLLRNLISRNKSSCSC